MQKEVGKHAPAISEDIVDRSAKGHQSPIFVLAHKLGHKCLQMEDVLLALLHFRTEDVEIFCRRQTKHTSASRLLH